MPLKGFALKSAVSQADRNQTRSWPHEAGAARGHEREAGQRQALRVGTAGCLASRAIFEEHTGLCVRNPVEVEVMSNSHVICQVMRRKKQPNEFPSKQCKHHFLNFRQDFIKVVVKIAELKIKILVN